MISICPTNISVLSYETTLNYIYTELSKNKKKQNAEGSIFFQRNFETEAYLEEPPGT